MPTPPTLELVGARLRPLRPSDAAAIEAYLRDPAVTEFTSYPEVSRTLVEAILDNSSARWNRGEYGKWALVAGADDGVIGTVGFNENQPAHRWAELAYDLARPHWGRGLMDQAVAAVLAWALAPGRLGRVHAYVRADNLRSQRLLERLQFRREGTLRTYRVCRGVPYDFHLYAILCSDTRSNG